jgi:hypothetical protein
MRARMEQPPPACCLMLVSCSGGDVPGTPDVTPTTEPQRSRAPPHRRPHCAFAEITAFFGGAAPSTS